MAELIQKTDTLNEGREKLNEAIKDAEKAKTDSSEAKSTANTALANSESTQTQLDTIVIEGDSSVEAAQARVDEKGQSHTTLKERIDDGFTKVNTQLAEKVNIEDQLIDLSHYCVLDGVADDTDSFELAVSDAKAQNRGLYLQRNKTLRLTRSTSCRLVPTIDFQGEVIIDFNGTGLEIGGNSNNSTRQRVYVRDAKTPLGGIALR